jgi:hypothetical protein
MEFFGDVSLEALSSEDFKISAFVMPSPLFSLSAQFSFLELQVEEKAKLNPDQQAVRRLFP